MNVRNVLSILGILLLYLGLAMVPALGISIYRGEGDLAAFALSIAITGGTGLGLYFALRRRDERMSLTHKEGFLIVTLAWVLASAFGGLPYLFHGCTPTFADAFFETMSGFTTTGSSVISGLDHLPRGILFWRALTHWIGGMGIIVLSIAILPLLGVGGMQLYKAELPSPVKDKLTPRIADTARRLWAVYVIISTAQFILLLLGGMEPFDAICHTFATMATGGFSTHDASVGHFGSLYVEIVITAFMIIAGMNFTLHYQLFTGNPRRFYADEELRFYLLVIVGATALVTINLRMNVYGSLGEALRYASFQVASIITTTGFATANFDAWPVPSKFVLLILMFIGGSAGSTGGAIKCLRFLLIIKHSAKELYRLMHPHAVVVVKLGKTAVPSDIMAGIRSFFFLYLAIAALGTLVLAFLGLDMLTSFSAVATTLGNVGPGFRLINPMTTFAEIPQLGKWILSFFMLLGRLEIFTVLVLLTPEFWKK